MDNKTNVIKKDSLVELPNVEDLLEWIENEAKVENFNKNQKSSLTVSYSVYVSYSDSMC